LVLFAAGAPSPLYAVYAARFRFSAATLTTVFAGYAIAVLMTRLVLGSLSDYLGRRPVIIAALLIDAAAMVLVPARHWGRPAGRRTGAARSGDGRRRLARSAQR
jgi:MFS family permease